MDSGGGARLPQPGPESSQGLWSPTAPLLVNCSFVNSLPSYQDCGGLFFFGGAAGRGQEPTLIILVCPLCIGQHLVKENNKHLLAGMS